MPMYPAQLLPAETDMDRPTVQMIEGEQDARFGIALLLHVQQD